MDAIEARIAAELAAGGDAELVSELAAPLHRLLDHYLHTGHTAALLLTRPGNRSARPRPAPA